MTFNPAVLLGVAATLGAVALFRYLSRSESASLGGSDTSTTRHVPHTRASRSGDGIEQPDIKQADVHSSREDDDQRVQEELGRLRVQDELRRKEELRLAAELSSARAAALAARGALSGLISEITAFQRRFPDATHKVAIPVVSPVPTDANAEQFNQFAAETSKAVREFQKAWRNEQSRMDANQACRDAAKTILGNSVTPPRSAAEYLARCIANERSMAAAESLSFTEERRIERESWAIDLFQRIAAVQADEVEAAVAYLLPEYLSTESEPRARALLTELSLRVQKCEDAAAQRERGRAYAGDMLGRMPTPLDDVVDDSRLASLREKLAAVATGTVDLNDSLRTEVDAWLLAFQRQRDRLLREAAAQVLRATLKDLGYETEDIENTLFMAGGIVHFQKNEWGRKYMRIRVSPETSEAHFHMVQAGDDPEPTTVDADHSYCDQGHAQLLDTLAGRGFDITRIRHIPAGDVPVLRVPEEEVVASGRQGQQRKATPEAFRTHGAVNDGRRQLPS